MTALEDIIKDQIRASGHMDIGSYMELCLGHPEHGYYMKQDPFGEAGDFTTAPEISQMFGELIGAWLADTWMQMGSPAKFILLECGAGRGTLMADALRATKGVKGFHEAMHLHLLEMSPVLKAAQEELLSSYDATWHMTLESIRVDSPVLVVGNEFLDALPVRQLVLREAGWHEKAVKLDINDTLCIGEAKADKGVKELIPPLLIPPKVGGHLEVSLQQRCILTEIMNIVLKQSGSCLFIDYGFIHSVSGDTLQAVRKHSYCGVLDSPGDVDITSHVNFSEISRLAMQEKMTVHGPVSQGDFLNRLGIGARARKLTQNATDAQRCDIEVAIKRLTGQDSKAKDRGGDMGALFKVIAFSSDPQIDLAGFA